MMETYRKNKPQIAKPQKSIKEFIIRTLIYLISC